MPARLQDLENTIGSWDMYGQEDKNRYNSLQSEFFERAANGLSRREYLLGLCAIGESSPLDCESASQARLDQRSAMSGRADRGAGQRCRCMQAGMCSQQRF